jgi:hypothetical protein
MSLKSEYLKKIYIIKSRQESMVMEMGLKQMEDRESEIKLEEKIENFKNNVQDKTLSLEICNSELFDLKKKYKPISKIENFIPKTINFGEKILDCKNKFNFKIQEIIIKEKENKRITIIQEIKIKGDFKNKNKILIDKDYFFIKKIENLNKIISNTKVIIKKIFRENEIGLGKKFINRKNKLLFLEKEYRNINCNRVKNNELREKIKNQEIENRLLKKQIEKKGDIELTKLNQYIKSQKIYIKNELSTQKKKEYFKNIKNRNKEYLEKISKNKLKLEELNKKLISLKENLSNNQIININYCNKIQKIPEKIEKEIRDIKSEIEEYKYDKLLISLEKKINLDLLEKNKYFYQEEIVDLVQNLKNQSKYLYQTEIELKNNYVLEINTFKINNTQQISDNKKNLNIFLEENLINLYNYKKINNRIEELKTQILFDNKELEETNKKLNNTEYILKKTKLKNKLNYKKIEEKNNNQKIDDLIEIEEINQKILSISN